MRKCFNVFSQLIDDKNKLFMLGDFTVTHNTTYAQSMTYNISNNGVPCLFFSYEVMIANIWKKFQQEVRFQ